MGERADDRVRSSIRPTSRSELGVPSSLIEVLVESVVDYAIFALDADGRVLSWNVGAERLKGYRPQEIIGRHFAIFYPAEQIKSGKPDQELAIAVADGTYEEEGWRIRSDGSRFWAARSATASGR